jgi:PA14 domain/Dolichyl-phosphate-mannose-protein mannosyltransferase
LFRQSLRPFNLTALTVVVLSTTVAATVLLIFAKPEGPAPGLRGRYFATPDWSGEPILERVDTRISTETLATPELAGRRVFSVEWTGSLIVNRQGIYHFATKSDDGTWLWIGGELVIDNGGTHPVRNVGSERTLGRGLYPFTLRYSQTGGDYFLLVGQTDARGVVSHPAPLIAEQMTYRRLRLLQLWPLGLVAMWYVAAGVVVAGGTRWLSCELPSVAEILRIWADRPLRIIVILGALACAAHIGHGVPAVPSFSSDELEPLDTLVASEAGFRHWNLRWPPLHALLLAGLLQPFAWARSLFGLSLTDPITTACMFMATRGFSVLLIALTLMFTFDGTRLLFGKRAGYFAATLLACSPVLVFFGSFGNLDTPHLFWVTFTFWTWLKLLQNRDLHWFAVFGFAVGCSIASKDQAFGYYVAAPIALVALVARERGGRDVRTWVAALADRRLIAVALATLAALALGHLLPWRFDRFMTRFAVMTGPASEPFQLFEPTLDGHIELFTTTAKLVVWAAGVPLAIAAAGGVVMMLLSGRYRLLLGMSIPVLTYYAAFLSVILYVYDRFLVGWLPIAAACGGMFLASAQRWRAGPVAVGRMVVIATLGAGILNAVGMNLVFYQDPRFAAWDWLRTNLPCGSSVGVTFNRSYIPPLDCFDVWPLRGGTVDAMVRRPQYLVFNEAYAKRLNASPSGSVFLWRLSAGQFGYERIARFESTPPWWAPLYWERRFWNRREDVETTVDKPLHAIEVWRSTRAEPPSVTSEPLDVVQQRVR